MMNRVGIKLAAALLLSITCITVGNGIAGASDNGGQGSDIKVAAQLSPQTDSLCVPAALALTRDVSSTASAFELTIHVNQRICDPVEVTAAVYAMPGNGVAWPQQLVETKKFTLAGRGDVKVTFTKTCRPVQFDVIVGDTPQTISPSGPWHGPLLFPFDTTTAQQHWGWTCEAPPVSTTTSTVPPHTVPPASVPSTTVPTGPASTVPPAGTPDTVPTGGSSTSTSRDTTTTVRPLGDPVAAIVTPVKATSQSPAVTAGAPAGTLARTGGDVSVAWIGLILLVAGAAAVVVSRSRRRQAA